MWFKKIYSFQLDQDDVKEVMESVREKMSDFSFEEDSVGNIVKNSGWVKFKDHYEDMCFYESGITYLRLLVATKSVPKQKLDRKLKERIAEETGGDPDNELTKAEINELKQAIEEAMILQEEPKYKEIVASIDEGSNVITVASGAKDAEEIVSFMRSTIGGSGIKAIPYFGNLSMRVFRDWIISDAPQGFQVGDSHDLSSDLGTKVSYKKVDSGDENMMSQLNAGYNLTKTSLIIDEKVLVSINEKGEISGCKLEDLGEEEISNEVENLSDGYEEALLVMLEKMRGEFLAKLKQAAIG